MIVADLIWWPIEVCRKPGSSGQGREGWEPFASVLAASDGLLPSSARQPSTSAHASDVGAADTPQPAITATNNVETNHFMTHH